MLFMDRQSKNLKGGTLRPSRTVLQCYWPRVKLPPPCISQTISSRLQPIKRDFILTPKYFYLIGREKVKKGPEKGQIREVLKKKVEVQAVNRVSLR